MVYEYSNAAFKQTIPPSAHDSHVQQPSIKELIRFQQICDWIAYSSALNFLSVTHNVAVIIGMENVQYGTTKDGGSETAQPATNGQSWSRDRRKSIRESPVMFLALCQPWGSGRGNHWYLPGIFKSSHITMRWLKKKNKVIWVGGCQVL